MVASASSVGQLVGRRHLSVLDFYEGRRDRLMMRFVAKQYIDRTLDNVRQLHALLAFVHGVEVDSSLEPSEPLDRLVTTKDTMDTNFGLA